MSKSAVQDEAEASGIRRRRPLGWRLIGPRDRPIGATTECFRDDTTHRVEDSRPVEDRCWGAHVRTGYRGVEILGPAEKLFHACATRNRQLGGATLPIEKRPTPSFTAAWPPNGLARSFWGFLATRGVRNLIRELCNYWQGNWHEIFTSGGGRQRIRTLHWLQLTDAQRSAVLSAFRTAGARSTRVVPYDPDGTRLSRTDKRIL